MALIGVSPNGQRWQLTREGEVLSLHLSQDEALDAARSLAGDEPSAVVLDDGSGEPVVVHDTSADGEDPGADRDARGAGHPEPNEAR